MSPGLYLRVHWIVWWYRLVFARLSGQRDTIHTNLEKIFTERSAKQRRGLERRVLSAQGRFFGEILNIEHFLPIVPAPEITGDGRDPFLEAAANGRPVVLLTGHIGNYVVGLQMLEKLGIKAGFLYRTRGNKLLDSRFDRILRSVGQTGFKIGHRKQRNFEANLRNFKEFLGEGHVVVMLGDHRDRKGEELPFLGKRAPTSLTPAKLALAHGAALIPCFVLRDGSKSCFRVRMDAPIASGEPADMMRCFNDAVSQVIAEDPAQWSWSIKRW